MAVAECTVELGDQLKRLLDVADALGLRQRWPGLLRAQVVLAVVVEEALARIEHQLEPVALGLLANIVPADELRALERVEVSAELLPDA